MLHIALGNFITITCPVSPTRERNNLEKLFGSLLFEKFVKTDSFSKVTTLLNRFAKPYPRFCIEEPLTALVIGENCVVSYSFIQSLFILGILTLNLQK